MYNSYADSRLKYYVKSIPSEPKYRIKKIPKPPTINKEDILKRKLARIELRNTILEMFGGRCSTCGYNKCKSVIHFHHVGEKYHHISSLFNKASLKDKYLPLLVRELHRCIPLCANCHYEIHHSDS